MAERPILFSGPMVRALLAGAKTQTRRTFKPRGFEFYTHAVSGDRYNEFETYRDGTWDESRISGSGSMRAFVDGEHLYGYLPCHAGDRLWVKETHAVGYDYDDADKPIGDEPHVFYAATECPRWYDPETDTWRDQPKWTPSIFMRRVASRLTLAVTAVRVERLHDISEADALAEGIQQHGRFFGVADADWDDAELTAVAAYARLWRNINGPESWGANPWVAAISFNVQRRNIDA